MILFKCSLLTTLSTPSVERTCSFPKLLKQATATNDHKPLANDHKGPNEPFPNSNYYIFRRLETRQSLRNVNKH